MKQMKTLTFRSNEQAIKPEGRGRDPTSFGSLLEKAEWGKYPMAADSAPAILISAESGCESKPDNLSATILVVEDDEDEAFFLKRALTRAGVLNPIQHVWDGQEALNYFQGSGKFGDRNQFPLPALVLLDLKLPHVMGLDVLKWFRNQPQFDSTVVLILSASQYPEDIANARRHGADDYLVKPSGLDQLDLLARTIRNSWLNTNRRPPPSRFFLSDGPYQALPMAGVCQSESPIPLALA